jgi:hypothetical protein
MIWSPITGPMLYQTSVSDETTLILKYPVLQISLSDERGIIRIASRAAAVEGVTVMRI